MKCNTCGVDLPTNPESAQCTICVNKKADELKTARGQRFKQYLFYSSMIALLLMLSISLKENGNSDQAQSSNPGISSQ